MTLPNEEKEPEEDVKEESTTECSNCGTTIYKSELCMCKQKKEENKR